MRPRVLSLLVLLATAVLTMTSLSGQTESIDGTWTGEIRIAGITLGMQVVFIEGGEAITAAIDIPQQNAAGLPLRNVTRNGAQVRFELPAGPGVAVFDGTLSGDRIEGTFTQGGAAGTFVLARGTARPVPDAPPADLPYDTEDVTFGHGDVTLAGTVTTPRGAPEVPAVVLISGSGSQTRDEDIAGFKVFGTLADELTRAGIAVLRYDDRGVGGSSGPANVTTTAYAADVLAAVELMAARPGIDGGRIGLIGHSEGALVAALAANQSDQIDFIVLMAGTAITGERVVRGQAEAMVRTSGGGDAQIAAVQAQQDRLFRAVRTGEGWDALEAAARVQVTGQVAALPRAQRETLGDPEAYVDGIVARQFAGARSDWYRFFLDYDPGPALDDVDVPVLALFGGKDVQVLPADNRPALEARFGDARASQLTVQTYDDANHLFQAANTGSPTEYATLPKAFVDGFTSDLIAWIASLSQ